MNHYVVTMYVDADSPDAIDSILGAAAMAGNALALGENVNIKNWIVDDDETPEQHP